MKKLEGDQTRMPSAENQTQTADTIDELSVHEQVIREFEHAADTGESELEQLKTEANRPKYVIPSPMISREDAAFQNINPNQIGEAYGVANQRTEPVDILEKVEDRDDDRWALNPASAAENDEV